MLYYIDLETNHYATYRHDGSQEDLSVILEGEDFFAEMRDRAASMLYTPDSEEVMRVFTKDNIIRTIDAQGTFAITYRLMQQGVPVWMTLKASRMADDERHLTVGISNVDAQMKRQEADKRLREEQATFSRIMALSGDYLAVYAVNPDTGVYHELTERQEYRDYVHLEGGQDFFADVVDKCRKVAHQDDLGVLESLLVRERILSEVRSNGTFSMTFRMNMDGVPLYVNMRAALVEERDGPQLIVGLSNVDRQTKRDIELTLTRRRANKDSLTGVKNKHAYVDFIIQLDQRIEAHEDVEFGVVVCDLNDLKRTNDSLGHQAGDQLLRDACHIICNVFKHSPVFRIGGDEFAVIVEGYDLEHLDELCAKLAHIDEEHLRHGGPVVACGASRYQDDASVAVVFDRADAAMYENKRALKQMG